MTDSKVDVWPCAWLAERSRVAEGSHPPWSPVPSHVAWGTLVRGSPRPDI